MSQWTHVSGVIRVDSFEHDLTKKHLLKLFGVPAKYEDSESFDNCKLPMGSEGSLDYAINKAGYMDDVGGTATAYTVAIWGDLRDYSEQSEILQWIKDVVKEIQSDCFTGWIRDLIVKIDVECHGSYIIYLVDDDVLMQSV